MLLWDVDGKAYYDFTSGYSALNFGHAPADLIDVATEQMRLLSHLTQQPTEPRILLAEKLVQLAAIRETAKCYFNVNGSRAIETAWKIAYHRRPGRLVCFRGSYHGRSLATAWLTKTARSQAARLVEQPVEFDYPPSMIHDRDGKLASLIIDQISEFAHSQADSISAIVVEPALGARGYYFPHPTFFHRLRTLADDHGWAIIDDEVQMGLGRCGAMLLCQQQNWKPDIIVLGKSLGGGLLPISAVLGPAQWLDNLPPGIESETFSGNPVACAVGAAVIDKLNRENMIQHGRELGEAMRQQLAAWRSELAHELRAAVCIDGQGCSAALEFSAAHLPPEHGGPAEVTRKLAAAALEAGVLVQRSGLSDDRIVLIPPLITPLAEAQQACESLRIAWNRVLASSPK